MDKHDDEIRWKMEKEHTHSKHFISSNTKKCEADDHDDYAENEIMLGSCRERGFFSRIAKFNLLSRQFFPLCNNIYKGCYMKVTFNIISCAFHQLRSFRLVKSKENYEKCNINTCIIFPNAKIFNSHNDIWKPSKNEVFTFKLFPFIKIVLFTDIFHKKLLY